MKSRILPAAADSLGGRPTDCADSPQEGMLNPQCGSPGEERMHVYAGGYITRMREALAEVFEAVRHVLGEAVFAELAEDYARSHPSHDYNLNFAGRHLPQFLRSWPRTQPLPFLPDLAQLEWLICQAFHAWDQPPVDPQKAAAIAADQWSCLTFVFQPSVGLVASAWPVLDIWQARKTPPAQININLVDRPQRVLVFRRDPSTRATASGRGPLLGVVPSEAKPSRGTTKWVPRALPVGTHTQVVCEPLDEAQHFVFSALHRGQALGAVCAELQQRGMEPPLSDWFSRWMRLGLIAHLASAKALC